MKRVPRIALLMGPLMAAFLMSCAEDETPFVESPRPAAPQSSMVGGHGMPPGHGASAPDADAMKTAIIGKVLEAFDSDKGYSYVHLELRDGKKEWAAVPRRPIKVGSSVAVLGPQVFTDFPTQSKMGTFKRLVLGQAMTEVDEKTGQPISSGPVAGMPPTNADPHAAAQPVTVTVEPGEVEKAADGLLVSEVHAQAAELTGKEVRVRGKVIRFTPLRGGVWAHIQDGSGSADKGDNDLTVILTEAPEAGSIVLVTGKVVVGHQMAIGPTKKQPILDQAKVEETP